MADVDASMADAVVGAAADAAVGAVADAAVGAASIQLCLNGLTMRDQ